MIIVFKPKTKDEDVQKIVKQVEDEKGKIEKQQQEEMKQQESEYDKMIKELKNNNTSNKDGAKVGDK